MPYALLVGLGSVVIIVAVVVHLIRLAPDA